MPLIFVIFFTKLAGNIVIFSCAVGMIRGCHWCNQQLAHIIHKQNVARYVSLRVCLCVCVCELEEKIKSYTTSRFRSSFVPDVLLSKYLIPIAVAIAPRTIYITFPMLTLHRYSSFLFSLFLYLRGDDVFEWYLSWEMNMCTEILFFHFSPYMINNLWIIFYKERRRENLKRERERAYLEKIFLTKKSLFSFAASVQRLTRIFRMFMYVHTIVQKFKKEHDIFDMIEINLNVEARKWSWRVPRGT